MLGKKVNYDTDNKTMSPWCLKCIVGQQLSAHYMQNHSHLWRVATQTPPMPDIFSSSYTVNCDKCQLHAKNMYKYDNVCQHEKTCWERLDKIVLLGQSIQESRNDIYGKSAYVNTNPL